MKAAQPASELKLAQAGYVAADQQERQEADDAEGAVDETPEEASPRGLFDAARA